MTATILTIAQQKGGAGKTTLAAQLAVALIGQGQRVALLDIDPQGSLGLWAELRGGGAPLVEKASGWRTEQTVQRLARDHDVVLIDSPPHAETEARIAVRAADLVLVPVQPSPLDLAATGPTLELAAREKTPALLVLNRVPARGRLAEELAGRIARLGAPLARARLGNRVAYGAAMAAGKGVTELSGAGPAAAEIAALAAEIVKGLKRSRAA